VLAERKLKQKIPTKMKNFFFHTFHFIGYIIFFSAVGKKLTSASMQFEILFIFADLFIFQIKNSLTLQCLQCCNDVVGG
jgi:hypothetical protein